MNVDFEICELLPEREEFFGWAPRPSVHQGNFNGTYQGGVLNTNINQTNQTNINGSWNLVLNGNFVG